MLSSCLVLLMSAAQPVGQEPPQAVPQRQMRPESAHPLPSEIIDYFSGTWNGSGSFVRSGKPVQSIFAFEPILNRQALQVTHEEKLPNDFAYKALMSVDTRTGGLVLLLVGNKNGGARLFRSTGWEGDRLVFVTNSGLRTWFAQERISFVRKSGSRFRATYEMSSDDGASWRIGDEQLFEKQSG